MIIIGATREKRIRFLVIIGTIFLIAGVFAVLYKLIFVQSDTEDILSKYTYETKEVDIVDDSEQVAAGTDLINDTKSIVKFKAQVADTQEKRELGLSFRKSINFTTHPLNYEGMLFIFPNDVQTGFWMKDMKFNLDIIFIDSNYKIIKIFEDLPPCSKDLSKCISYGPTSKYRYVLEINGGESDTLGIKEGQSILVK